MYRTIGCLLILSATSSSDLIENEDIQRDSSWLKSAETVLAGPAGHVVVEVAKDLLSRSAGNSQVLSLNLTNLLVIILLKVLIFAAGLLGAGHRSHFARVRSLSQRSFFEDGEGHLITGFLVAQGSEKEGCLYQAACRSPIVAFEYARAAKALLSGIEKFEGISNSLRYNNLTVLAEKAAYDGYTGTPCDLVYNCNI